MHYTREILAIWEKHKDLSTSEEWKILIHELGKYDDPESLPLAVRCLEGIEKRYEERMQLGG